MQDISCTNGPQKCLLCGVCGELCDIEITASHKCLYEHTSDPEERFMINDGLASFFPIIEGEFNIVKMLCSSAKFTCINLKDFPSIFTLNFSET